MAGLAGPLHGLANQEVLVWLTELKAKLPPTPTKADVKTAIWDTLKAGRVVPGLDMLCFARPIHDTHVCSSVQLSDFLSGQRQFALRNLPDDPMFKLVSDLYEIVPDVLTEQGKTKNPWPNVDAHSGVLLQHYGLVEADFYTVLFGISRAMGVLPSLVMDHILAMPIERPKSVTSDWIRHNVKKA
jgi:citrate synthase